MSGLPASVPVAIGMPASTSVLRFARVTRVKFARVVRARPCDRRDERRIERCGLGDSWRSVARSTQPLGSSTAGALRSTTPWNMRHVAVEHRQRRNHDRSVLLREIHKLLIDGNVFDAVHEHVRTRAERRLCFGQTGRVHDEWELRLRASSPTATRRPPIASTEGQRRRTMNQTFTAFEPADTR